MFERTCQNCGKKCYSAAGQERYWICPYCGGVVQKLDIADRLEAAGFNNYTIDYERGFAIVFFEGLLAKETIRETEERRRREFERNYCWSGYELRRRE